LLWIAIPARAQLAPSGPGRRLEPAPRAAFAGTSAESQPNESTIGPGDLLDITVFQAPEMNRTVRVSPNGEISLDLIGTVNAAGLTARQLESVLEDHLRKSYMKDPHVGIFVRQLESHPVSVMGAVKKPGVFQIQETKTLIEVLSMAEGLADDAGDTVFVMHGAGYAVADRLDSQGEVGKKTGAVEAIRLKKLLESSDPTLNVPIHPGDIVKVTRAGIVYVVGEVHKPGGFVLQNNENISVLQALALAEGLTRTSAKKQARIIRTEVATGDRTEIPLNLDKVLAGKVPDPVLQPEDIVFVPNSLAKGALFRGSEAILVTATGAAIYRW